MYVNAMSHIINMHKRCYFSVMLMNVEVFDLIPMTKYKEL